MQVDESGPQSYPALRAELVGFVAEFEVAARRPGLFAERVYDDDVSADGWGAFVAAQGAGRPAGTWVVLPSGDGCHRFTGDLTMLDQFQRLAEAAWRVVATLAARHPQVATFAGDDTHELGWLELVFDTALAASTARLHVEYGRWGVAGDVSWEEMPPGYWVGTGPGRYPRHPFAEVLAFDVFRSSAEAIRCWLDPDAIVTVGDRLADLPVYLPAELPRPGDDSPRPDATPPESTPPTTKPTWDAGRCELRWGDTLVKRFAPQAIRQMAVLAAFEAAGWPPAIDNPLPYKTPAHLGNTVDGLKKGLGKNAVLLFRRSASGKQIRWEYVGG